MKKVICLIGVLILAAVFMSGCIIPTANPFDDESTEKIIFPFAVSDVENIEIYSFTESEKKTITEDSTITYLYTFFTELSVENKKSSSENYLSTVRIVFNLADNTRYELTYRAVGVKDGRLQSKYFDYFTASDVIGVLKSVSGDIEQIPTADAQVNTV